jgi:curved DNA-binding protein CbpA
MGSVSDDGSRNLYTVLDLKPNASPEEIRTAYYELARLYHPDRRKQDEKAEEAFRAIARAAAILRDPEQRRLYDRGDISETTLSAAPQHTQSRRDYRRPALVFFVTLAVTSFIATGLSVVVLRRTSQIPILSRNDDGRAATSKVAGASLPPDEHKRPGTHAAEPSGLPLEDSQPWRRAGQQPAASDDEKRVASKLELLPPVKSSASSSSAVQRPAVPSQSHAEAPVPAHPAKSPPNVVAESGSRSSSTFALPSFDVPSDGRFMRAKLSLMRDHKPKTDDCSLTLTAKAILLHVSAAIRAK